MEGSGPKRDAAAKSDNNFGKSSAKLTSTARIRVRAMLSNHEFTALIQRVRSGDQNAARELVQMYETEIRRAARIRLTDPAMRRIVDSMDICQSVFGRFFKALSEGTLEFEEPGQVLNLLISMTRNRVIDEHRRQTSQKRLLVDGQPTPTETLVQAGQGPRTAFLTKELLSKIRARLTPDELIVADLRNSGRTWDEVADETGESVDTVRKRLDRALERVRGEVQP